jgi:hypothetical protein
MEQVIFIYKESIPFFSLLDQRKETKESQALRSFG